jgi:hypothetical protein
VVVRDERFALDRSIHTREKRLAWSSENISEDGQRSELQISNQNEPKLENPFNLNDGSPSIVMFPMPLV